MEKNTRLNNLIKSLILSFNDYDNNLKNRFKVDSIILGLEENVEKNLNKLINLSASRYKYAKYGVKLDSILNRQKVNYENLSRIIKNDKIYSSNFIDLEKEKLFKSVVKVKNKEIFDIRDKLINALRSSKNKIKNENKTNNNNKINSEEKMPKLKIKISNNNISSLSSTRKSLKYLSNKYILSRRQTVKNNNKNESKIFVDNLVKEDYDKFFTTIDSYHTFLEKLKNISNEKYKGKRIKVNKANFEQMQKNLSPNCLNFLAYKEKNIQSKTQNYIKKDLDFDLKTIKKIKIKHDRNNKLKNKLFNYNQKENNESINSGNNQDKNSSSISLNLIENLNNANQDNINNNSIEQKDDLSSKKSIAFKTFIGKDNYNYKNTANIVLNETEKGLSYRQNFINKRKIFNNYFNKCFQNSKNIKQKRNMSNNENSTNELKNEHIKKKLSLDQNEIYEYNLKKRYNIKKDFQDIYERKKLEWKEQDKLKELKKLKENQKLKDIDNFLLNGYNK